MSPQFLITSLIVVLLPGTGVLYTLSVALGRGFVPGVVAAFGCTIGIVPAALAGIIGLAAIFHTSALAFQIVKYAGAAYLLYMAWNMARQKGTLDVDANCTPVSFNRFIIDGALLNTLNPKLSLFFLAFLPQFVPAQSDGATTALIAHAGIFMAITFIIFVGYAACAAAARQYVLSKPAVLTWTRRLFASTFALLGLKLALSER